MHDRVEGQKDLFFGGEGRRTVPAPPGGLKGGKATPSSSYSAYENRDLPGRRMR